VGDHVVVVCGVEDDEGGGDDGADLPWAEADVAQGFESGLQ
jgi:hypothetical protein